MARAINMELRNKKNEILNDTFGFIRNYIQHSEKVKVDRFYNDNPDAKETWRTKAYFIQELKRSCPSDIKFISIRRAGTFATKNDEQPIEDIEIILNFKKMRFAGEYVTTIPETATKIKKPALVFRKMPDIEAVYREGMCYFVKRTDGKIIQYLPVL